MKRSKIEPPPSPPRALRNRDEFGLAVIARISVEGTGQVEIWNFDHTTQMARELLAWLPKGIEYLEMLEAREAAQRERRLKKETP